MNRAVPAQDRIAAPIRHDPGRPYRLDLLQNPYGVPESVLDALSRPDLISRPAHLLADDLRLRLAHMVGVSSNWIVLANGIDELHAMIAAWRSEHGPLVTFPPTDPELERWIARHASQFERIARGRRFNLPSAARDLRLPLGATAVVMSPNDPTGTVLTVQEAVRLSRQTAITVIDERHGAYSPRTLQPLVREFENIVLLQTFETWAALDAFPLAWAIAPPQLAAEIEAQSRPSGVAAASLVTALAALDNLSDIQLTVRRVMIEKGRLFRQIRKMSMISPPFASWANFLLCRFERGNAAFFVPRLAERGIIVAPVHHPRLTDHVRISAVSAEATNALKTALIDIALEL